MYWIIGIIYYIQDNGRTVLFYAALSGILDLVEKLLEQEADPNIIDMVYYAVL
jgi:ankyrin repeat protein